MSVWGGGFTEASDISHVGDTCNYEPGERAIFSEISKVLLEGCREVRVLRKGLRTGFRLGVGGR